MRKGADSFGRSAGGHASRGVRHTRRRDAVWLVTGATPSLAMNAQKHHTTGALALNNANSESELLSGARRCALIVERDPALAHALTHALQTRFEPEWSVRYISDNRPLASTPRVGAAEIIVFDASAPDTGAIESYQRLRTYPSLYDAQAIFVTAGASSYQLSQHGISAGVVLREPHHLDDIVALVAEALSDS